MVCTRAAHKLDSAELRASAPPEKNFVFRSSAEQKQRNAGTALSCAARGTAYTLIGPPPRRQPSRSSHVCGYAVSIGSYVSRVFHANGESPRSTQPPNAQPDENGSIEPARREVALVLAMLAPVVEHVAERVPRLARRRDDLLVVPVGEHEPLRRPSIHARCFAFHQRGLSAACAPPTSSCLSSDRGDLDVDVLRGADLKRLHAARERHPVLRFDEQVQVIALDAQVHDAAVRALGNRERGPPERPERHRACACARARR